MNKYLGTPINITKSLPELAGKKITLSYSPATQADEDVINLYLPKPHPDGTPIQPNELPTSLPAYLINLKPELRIDGVVVAIGTSVGMGNTETFKMTFTAPKESPDVITNVVQVGEYLGIAIDLGRISQEQLLTLKAKLETTRTKLELQSFQDIEKDDLLGDILYATALFYFAKLNIMNNSIAKQIGVNAIQLPSENIFSTQLKVNMFFNTPISASSGGMRMDVDRILSVVQSLDGDSKKGKLFMQASGIQSSTLEHSIPEEILSTQQYPTEGISAIKAIKIANDAGIPVYKINRSNIDSVIPQLQLDSGTISDITNAVNAGKEVLVSASQISFKGWTGCGYIITDPVTGASSYMISGGLSGSWEDSVWIDISWFAGIIILSFLAAAGIVAVITLIILAIDAIAPALIAAALYWVPLFILAYLLCDTYGLPPQGDITDTVLCAIILTLLIHLGI